MAEWLARWPPPWVAECVFEIERSQIRNHAPTHEAVHLQLTCWNCTYTCSCFYFIQNFIYVSLLFPPLLSCHVFPSAVDILCQSRLAPLIISVVSIADNNSKQCLIRYKPRPAPVTNARLPTNLMSILMVR